MTRARDVANIDGLLTTTGDTYYASAAGTPARLGIGSSTQVLTVSGGVPAWATPAGGGKVLQVVGMSETGWDQSATTTWIDNNVTATITPTSATSKILCLVNLCGTGKANSATWGEFRLMRGATSILVFEDRAGSTGDAVTVNVATTSTSFLDAPATTSATTYKIQFRSGGGTNRAESGIASAYSTMVLMEIGA